MNIIEIDWEQQKVKNLLADAKMITESCDAALNNSDSTDNHQVIKIIKKEFIEIVNSIEKNETIPVLDKHRKIYSTFIILDSANLSMNQDLFNLVYMFAKRIKKVHKKYLQIKEL